MKIEKNKVVNTLLNRQYEVFGKKSNFNNIIKFFPLHVKNKTIGFIQIDNIYSQQTIQKSNIKFLMLFINQASIAIEKAEI